MTSDVTRRFEQYEQVLSLATRVRRRAAAARPRGRFNEQFEGVVGSEVVDEFPEARAQQILEAQSSHHVHAVCGQGLHAVEIHVARVTGAREKCAVQFHFGGRLERFVKRFLYEIYNIQSQKIQKSTDSVKEIMNCKIFQTF